jgi:hypothetical protein
VDDSLSRLSFFFISFLFTFGFGCDIVSSVGGTKNKNEGD